MRRPLKVTTLVYDIPVSQPGGITPLDIALPDTAVRVVGVLTTNAVTDQALTLNVGYRGAAASNMAVTQVNVTGLTRGSLLSNFSFFDAAPAAGQSIYFAFPNRLGAPSFQDAAGAALAFTRRGTVNIVAADLGVNESFALYESQGLGAGARRVYVRGLNLTGRTIIPTPDPASD